MTQTQIQEQPGPLAPIPQGQRPHLASQNGRPEPRGTGSGGGGGETAQHEAAAPRAFPTRHAAASGPLLPEKPSAGVARLSCRSSHLGFRFTSWKVQ